MGQELYFRLGGDGGRLLTDKIMINRAEIVQDVHEDFIHAGAQIITTNTYMLDRSKLEKAGLGPECGVVKIKVGQLACQAREKSNTNVEIAEVLPPLFGRFSKPIWVSWALQDNGSKILRSSDSLTKAHDTLKGQPVGALFVNCCSPESESAAIPEFVSLSGCPVGGLANGFKEIPIDWVSSDKIEALGRREDLSKINYASHVKNWIASFARRVGGCCEIGRQRIAYLRQALDEQRWPIRSYCITESIFS